MFVLNSDGSFGKKRKPVRVKSRKIGGIRTEQTNKSCEQSSNLQLLLLSFIGIPSFSRVISDTDPLIKVAVSKVESGDDGAEVNKLNGDIGTLDVPLAACEHAVANLEQHIDTATRLTARVANIRSRYETLKQRKLVIITSKHGVCSGTVQTS